MKIALITVAFPPLRSSCAVQLRDLALEFSAQGHEVTVFTPDSDLGSGWQIELWQRVQVVRLRAQKVRDIGYIRRTFGELILPYVMLHHIRKSLVRTDDFDAVVWYSPTIFLGPVVNFIKTKSGCRSYLVLRDIFPEWAVDLGLMKRGLVYRFFDSIAHYQYSVADVIGVQSPGNLGYFDRCSGNKCGRVEVLNNWLAHSPDIPCSIRIDETSLAGRKIFVYAGNMGVAQSLEVFIELARSLQFRDDIGFVFVGRGSDVPRLRERVSSLMLTNILFFDEIEPDEISGLYAQCHVGLIALDSRHKSHNIPGKFLSYMQSGLPVLACVNPANDLIAMIEKNKVGYVCESREADIVYAAALSLLDDIASDVNFTDRCRKLFGEEFSPQKAVNQIVTSLKNDH